jgi:energy-coupling factor transport system ATP-binding protein
MYKIGKFSFSFEKSVKQNIFCLDEFYLPKKGLVLIAGPSGAGKSTFLNLLKGIIPEYIDGELTGDILFNGKTLTGENFKNNLEKIVYLFQNPFAQIIHNKTVDEFFFSLENFQADYQDAKKVQIELTKKFELTSLWSKKTRDLSHGECQKLLLASLLALAPEVLLLDEPTAFLDPYERRKFYEILDFLKKEHLIVMVDHHVREVFSKIDVLVSVDNRGEVRLENELKLPDFRSIKYNIPATRESPHTSIKLKNLHFSYAESAELIDIENEILHSGEIIIIKGRNGSGKSTLLKLISGFLPATKGTISVLFEEKKVSNELLHQQIGYIFQDPESSFLFDSLKEELGTQNFGFSLEELERSPFLFSEGEKRRISIFLAIAQNKNILLYDEPTFGQDENNIQMLVDIILNLKKMNKLQIIISHDEDFIEKVGDRVLSLKDKAAHG